METVRARRLREGAETCSAEAHRRRSRRCGRSGGLLAEHGRYIHHRADDSRRRRNRLFPLTTESLRAGFDTAATSRTACCSLADAHVDRQGRPHAVVGNVDPAVALADSGAYAATGRSSQHRSWRDSHRRSVVVFSRWASATAPWSVTKTSSARGTGKKPSSSMRRSCSVSPS